MQRIFVLLLITLGCGGLFAVPAPAAPSPPVIATEDPTRIIMDNGIARLQFSKAESSIVSVWYRHDNQEVEVSRTMPRDSIQTIHAAGIRPCG